ncbi:dATP/dGTP diphosphohydrolase domain-containing protein [Methylophaga lonarensis]|uniref:dATP/dGTP diphosphohydrolase domain-containing protein n=1 Tax=Methylophaga lonarensis TaxID=999151 RepID=UPI003D29094D
MSIADDAVLRVKRELAAERAGQKDDAGKLRFDLMPVDAERMVVQVLTFGAAKYGAENWREVADTDRRYYAACRRHLEAWRAGELLDAESGQHHLAHAICCLLFLLQLDIESDVDSSAAVSELARSVQFLQKQAE